MSISRVAERLGEGRPTMISRWCDCQHRSESTMKYLCLVYLDEKRLDELSDSDCLDYDEAIRKSGHCIASEALQSVQTATTVRIRNGKVSVTDGPFAETKEQLAGFYLIDAT